MRIVIDFQNKPAGPSPAELAAVRQLAARIPVGNSSDELWVAAPLRSPALLEDLRVALDGSVPRGRVRACDSVKGPLSLLLRRHALAELRPGVVLVFAPEAMDDAPFPVLAWELAQGDADTLITALRATAAEQAAAPAIDAAPRKPRLAYISPLLPAKSGIADYASELVPELAPYYEVELIVGQEQVDDVRLDGLPRHDVEWFRAHAHAFDRVLYHFGNSHAHQHMFELIREVPGVVALHDFFFSGILDNLEREEYLPQGFLKAVYESHGFTGLLDHRKIGRPPAIWKYPVNRGVLDNATGVIVNSEFSKQLAETWYGAGAAADWRTIPLLKGKPERSTRPGMRERARARLQLTDQDFLVCSFGMLGRTKLNEELLDAFLASSLAQDPHCHLAFVGENDPGLYGANLVKKIKDSGVKAHIRIAGYADADLYADYLAAGDAAVQLRASTRGESSGASLDCLLYGLPTIINAHGSTALLPDDCVIKLPDEFAVEQLSHALEQVHGDIKLRARLSANGQAHMQRHAPDHAARLYRDALEHFAQHGPQAAYRALVREAAPRCPENQLPELAAAVAFNRAPTAPRQLFVDVSAMVESDLKTGIQRVVRSILLHLLTEPPAGFRIEPVFTVGGNNGYRYARNWTLKMIANGGDPINLALEDAPVDLRPGDVFLGLDLFTNGTAQNQQNLIDMRARGVEITFVVYDLLPILRPDVFPFGAEQHFTAFLHTVRTVSDGVLCISRAVADEFADWAQQQQPVRKAPLQVGFFHLGADIDASVPSKGLPPDAHVVLDALTARPSFLMVGTVEPRKGQAQALAAFEQLWAAGVDANLVIVGKHGWMVDELAERLRAHPENGKRLFWLAGVSDEMLLKLYAGSSALLAPSEGEGFGLPLIEAAQHDIPIIARSLPVFREVAGEHAYYFEGKDPADLARAVTAWLALWKEDKAPLSTGMPWLTWEQSAHQVVDVVIGGNWHRSVPGAGS
jgi:glycosyltransferase involved in cell wall biosynthesis